MEQLNNKNLYIFIDESGNFDFSPKGTKYFVLTCISTINPLDKRDTFLSLKYELLREGINQEYLHATEDRQIIRDRVFCLIEELNDFDVDSVVAQKNKVNWSLYEKIDAEEKFGSIHFKTTRVEEKFYKQISETLLQYVIRRYIKYKDDDINKIVIIFDALFNKRKQEFVKKYLKTYFKNEFSKIPYVYFHQVKADVNCQIADYCGWAIYIKSERNELRSYNKINNKVKSEFDIFERGTTVYYKYKN